MQAVGQAGHSLSVYTKISLPTSLSVYAPPQGGDAHGPDLPGQRHPGPGLLAALLRRRPLRSRDGACSGRN